MIATATAWLGSKAPDGEPLSAEARSVLKAGFGEIEARAQTTANTAGGYSIPEQMMSEITRSMLAFGPMYDPGVTREIVTTGGNPMPWPTVDDTSSTAGGHTEGATLTDDGGKDVTFGLCNSGVPRRARARGCFPQQRDIGPCCTDFLGHFL